MKFNILVLAVVEAGCGCEGVYADSNIKTELYSFKTAGGDRFGNFLKN